MCARGQSQVQSSANGCSIIFIGRSNRESSNMCDWVLSRVWSSAGGRSIVRSIARSSVAPESLQIGFDLHHYVTGFILSQFNWQKPICFMKEITSLVNADISLVQFSVFLLSLFVQLSFFIPFNWQIHNTRLAVINNMLVSVWSVVKTSLSNSMWNNALFLACMDGTSDFSYILM